MRCEEGGDSYSVFNISIYNVHMASHEGRVRGLMMLNGRH